jgi:CRISPR-associated protein Cas5h
MTELDVTGRECISFTVSGDWGHFRRIDTTNDKLTYHVIPRTTVAGLIAAILGLPRDSYYDIFSPETSAIAIEPLTPLRTMQVPMLTVPTTSGDIVTAEGTSGKTVVSPSALETKRQRRTFEYIRNPSYRIHAVLTDIETRETMADRLDVAGDSASVRSVYTPALGKSECLATITDTNQTTVTDAGTVDVVDSILPETQLTPTTDVRYSIERTPSYMTATDGGRKTTEFLSYVYNPAGDPLEVEGVSASNVDGSNVIFV